MPDKKDFDRFPCCGHQHFGPCATDCKTCVAEAAKPEEKPEEKHEQREGD